MSITDDTHVMLGDWEMDSDSICEIVPDKIATIGEPTSEVLQSVVDENSFELDISPVVPVPVLAAMPRVRCHPVAKVFFRGSRRKTHPMKVKVKPMFAATKAAKAKAINAKLAKSRSAKAKVIANSKSQSSDANDNATASRARLEPDEDSEVFACDVDDEDADDSVLSEQSDTDALVEAAALPQGPDSELGVYKWPKQHVADALNHPLTLAADVAELGGDVFINTSYSGMGGPEMVVPPIQHEFRQQGIDVKIICFRAAELSENRRSFLLEHKAECRPLHIQTDICQRLPTKVYDLLNGYRSRLKQLLYQHSLAMQARVDSAQNEYLQAECAHAMASSNAPDGTLRPELSKLSEAVEEAKCRLLCSKQESLDSYNQVRKKLSDKYLAEATKVLDRIKLHGHVFCEMHDCKCPVFPSSRSTPPRTSSSFVIEIAGITCVPWSSMGLREGWLHDSSLPCLTMLKGFVDDEPDAFICECTRLLDHDHLAAFVVKKFIVQHAIISPAHSGIPAQRMRKYILGRHKRTVVIKFDYSQESYLRMFGKKLILNGLVYFVASAEARAKWISEMALKKQLPAACPNGEEWLVEDVLRGGFAVRLRGYKRLGSDMCETGPAIVDLTQSYTRSFSLRVLPKVVPALLQKSHMYSLRKDQPLLPYEHFLVQGIPLHPLLTHLQSTHADDGKLPDCYFPFRRPFDQWRGRKMTDSLFRSITGNAMHLSSVGSVLIFLLVASKKKNEES